MSIKVIGVESVLAELKELSDSKKIEKGVARGCMVVEAAAKKKAPKDTGALISSITYEVDGTTGTVFTPLFYAPYIEFGTGLFGEKGGRKDVPWRYQADDGSWYTTSGQKPQPFMRPALNDNRGEILRAIAEGLSR